MALWLIEPFHAQRQRSVGNTLRRARWRWVRLCFYTCLWIHWGREWRSEVDICKTKRKIWTLSHTLFLHLLQLSAPLLELVKTAEPTGMCVSLPCAVWLYYSNMRTNFFFQKALLFNRWALLTIPHVACPTWSSDVFSYQHPAMARVHEQGDFNSLNCSSPFFIFLALWYLVQLFTFKTLRSLVASCPQDHLSHPWASTS